MVKRSVAVCGVLLALLSVGAGAADVVIRSVPVAVPPQQVQAAQGPRVVTVSEADLKRAQGSCPCGHSLACVGPKGGRYCVNSRGQKKYM